MTEKKKNIPELRFPEFEEEWKDNLFGSFYEFMQTYSFARNDLNYETGEIKNIHYGDIHTKFNNNFIAEKEDLPFINHEKIPSKIDENNFCRIGDLVIADASEDYNDVGKTIEIRSLGENKILAGLHTFLARPIKNKIAIGFMGYYLQTSYLKLQRMKLATGISVLGISKSNLKKVRINLPSNPEQQKIASFLTSVDERIQQLTKKKELLEKYKKGIMQKIFSQQIRFKDDDGNDFPDWGMMKLIQFLKPTIRKTNKPNSNYLSLGIRSHGKGLFHKPNFDPEKIEMDFLFRVMPKDLIVNITFAWEGAIAIVADEDKYGLVSHRFPTYVFDEKKVLHKFFRFIITSKKFIYQMDLISPGGAGRNRVMSKTDFLKIKWNIPCIPEQQKIADFLSSIDKKIEAVITQLEKTKEFKKGLLQKMFV